MNNRFAFKHRTWLWVLLAAGIFTANQLIAQTDESSVIILPPLASDNQSYGLSVNNLGVAAGFSFNNGSSVGDHAVMWSADGLATDLGLGPNHWAVSINDNGQVLVVSSSANPSTPIVWNAGTAMTLSNFMVNVVDPFSSATAHINNLGQVAGFVVQSGVNDVAIYDTGTKVISNLGLPPGGVGTYGTAVNIHGHVIANEGNGSGDAAYFYDGASWTNINITPGYESIQVTALNDSDEVVGMADYAGTSRAFSWTPSGGATFLDSGAVVAYGLNNNGVIVGNHQITGGTGSSDFPFVNFCGSNLDVDTTVLGPANQRPPFWTKLESIVYALNINDSSQIVGTGYIDGGGFQRGYVLPPVGSSQYLPYLPQCGSSDLWIFIIVGTYLAWVDPATASGFHYAMQSDALFTEIANFPTGFSNTVTVSVDGKILGQFGLGQSVVFSNYAAQLGSSLINSNGVKQFDVTGIRPLADPQNQQAFPLQVGFDHNSVTMTMAAIDASPPPLSIIASGTNVILSWPALVAGWTLQTNNDLTTGTWSNYPGPILNNTVTNPAPGGNLFFRLMLP